MWRKEMPNTVRREGEDTLGERSIDVEGFERT